MEKLKIYEFDPVIYPCKLWVTYELNEKLNETFELFDGSFSGDTELPIQFSGAMTFSVRNKVTNALGYLVAFKSKKKMTIDMITHEARHVGDMLFYRIGEDPQHSESACYFTGWVAGCIDKVRKGKA